jgi:hypothetical protein
LSESFLPSRVRFRRQYTVDLPVHLSRKQSWSFSVDLPDTNIHRGQKIAVATIDSRQRLSNYSIPVTVYTGEASTGYSKPLFHRVHEANGASEGREGGGIC